MCAIAGCLYFQKTEKFSLKTLLKRMHHRGPDATDYIDQESWSIGFNRLAITSEKETSTQPLWSLDKRFCFVFNGEIYNYKEIKKTLETKNYQFKTLCDAEVLFYSYLEYGTEAFLKCQGMFACAIFDTLEKKWTLVRDPLGIKPLYFQIDKNQFVFSSEIKALLTLKKPGINKKVLPYYLQKRFVLGKETLFSEIFRLQAGEIMTVSSKKDIKITKYWVPHFSVSKNKKERFQDFCAKLRESVRLSSESKSNEAILLSGGVDSCLLNALIHSFCSKRSSLPSVYFFDNKYDKKERAFVEHVIRKTKQDFHVVSPEEKDFLLLPKAIKALEEPLGDSIIIPTYKLLKSVSEKNKVVFSGEGIDELLGGYVHHWLFYFLKKFQGFLYFPIEYIFPESVFNFLFPYSGKFEKKSISHLLNQLRNKGLSKYLDMLHLFNKKELRTLFPGLLEETKLTYPKVSSLKDVMKFDIQNWLANYNLLRIDKLSMVHSLEVRVPYLNLDFVNVCLGLSTKDMISLFTRKKILRSFAYKKSLLAFKIAYRKKQAFTFQDNKVYKKEYNNFVRDHLDDSFKRKWDINSKALENLLETNSKYLETQKKITSLLNLSVWTKEFF
ncbi:MAG: asparagine synthase (glutamine-hydrolyzing) [Bdellovibrionales bacterium]|nr:asparagine synthase (glutamine-hydrolyzing) [Bdellovibrionales bacterium]